MKSILRKLIFYVVALFLTTQALDGVNVKGGLTIYLFTGAILSVLFMVVKPIISLITLPLNMLTLGLFSFLTNAIILYLLTIFVPYISITSFQFNGLSFLGFVIPDFSVNTFFAFIIASFFLSFIVEFLKWLTEK